MFCTSSKARLNSSMSEVILPLPRLQQVYGTDTHLKTLMLQ